MARVICSLCGWDTRPHPETSRTKHLADIHKMIIFERMVRRNFLRPHEVTDQDRLNWEVWQKAQKMLVKVE